MLVIRKGNVLDHLDGTVGTIDNVGIHFVIDGEDVALKREKIFGIVYARRNADVGKPVCEVTTTGGDFIRVQSAQWSDGQLKAVLLGGAQIVIPGDQIAHARFQPGEGPLPLAAGAARGEVHALLRPGLDLLSRSSAGRGHAAAGQQGIRARPVDSFPHVAEVSPERRTIAAFRR